MTKFYTAAALILFSYSSWGQPGTINTNFNGGTVITPFSGEGSEADDMIIQADGKIIAAGYSKIGGKFRFGIARYSSNGTLDASFGNGGEVTTLIGSTDSWAHAVALQPDGKILVGGYATFASADFALARYNANGSLDPSFGTGGIVTTDFGSFDRIQAVTVLPGGKILAVGEAFNGLDYDIATVRYNSDGSLDAAFTNAIGSGDDFVKAVLLQPDGKILLTGTSNDKMSLVRFSSPGILDPSFGNGGKVFTSAGPSTENGMDLALLADGKIILTGSVWRPPFAFDIAVLRYTSSGTLDQGFGTNGVTFTDYAGSFDNAVGVAIQNDGKIIVGGETIVEGFNDFFVVRYSSSGIIDQNFGNAGMATTAIGSSDDIAYSMELSGTNIYMAGVVKGTTDAFGLASFTNDATPLPLRLIDFSAYKENKNIIIQWQTASEENIQDFVVEKSSDGKKFDFLTQIASSGKSSGDKYSVSDDRPLAGINYYRLKSIERNGSINYSKIVAIRTDIKAIEVFPNPVYTETQLLLPAGLFGVVYIDINDVSGKIIRSIKLELNGNATSSPIDLTNFLPGTYFINIKAGSSVYTNKILKR